MDASKDEMNTFINIFWATSFEHINATISVKSVFKCAEVLKKMLLKMSQKCIH